MKKLIQLRSQTGGIALLLAALLASAALAQDATSSIRGFVRDANGPIPLATVSAVDINSGFRLSTTADEGGTPASDNRITDNHATGNEPYDINDDGTGTGNRFDDNRCDTSSPEGLCGDDNGDHHDGDHDHHRPGPLQPTPHEELDGRVEPHCEEHRDHDQQEDRADHQEQAVQEPRHQQAQTAEEPDHER